MSTLVDFRRSAAGARSRASRPTVAVAAALTLLAAGCDRKPVQPADAARPPREVGVVMLKPRSVALCTDLPGRTTAFQTADVRPQVTGVVTGRLFTEGGDVQGGQPLHQIDPAVHQATYDSALAALAHSRAALHTARAKAARHKPLALAQAVSQQDYDDAVASSRTAVRAELSSLAAYFPPGLKVVYPLDTEPFITLSIQEVAKTLLEAILLVAAVMYVFLQNVRATLIPTIAVPVVLLGTFGVLAVLGYSINTLTMLAMVLAVGLLVDDAIVVVENVQRVMAEDGLSPRDATRKSMRQISGALVGIALVLSAVFLPMAFLGGSSGVIYRQFSVTIVSAMALSVLVALVLTPALCAILLKAPDDDLRSWRAFAWFNRGFDRINRRYARGVGWMTSRWPLALLVFLGLTGGMAFLFLRLPSVAPCSRRALWGFGGQRHTLGACVQHHRHA